MKTERSGIRKRNKEDLLSVSMLKKLTKEVYRQNKNNLNNQGRLKYNELLELYIRYLKIRQRMMNKIPSYRNDYKCTIHYIRQGLKHCIL